LSPFDRLGRQQHIDRKSLEQQRKATSLLGPRELHLFHSMFRAVDAGWACMQKCLELHRVQVPPAAFGSMIVASQFLATLRTAKLGPLRLRDTNLDLLKGNIELHVNHFPRPIQPKNPMIKFGFVHGSSPWPRILPNPHETRMDHVMGRLVSVTNANEETTSY